MESCYIHVKKIMSDYVFMYLIDEIVTAKNL